MKINMDAFRCLIHDLDESSLGLEWFKDNGMNYYLCFNSMRLERCWKQVGTGYANLCGNSFKTLDEAKVESFKRVQTHLVTLLEELYSRFTCNSSECKHLNDFESHALATIVKHLNHNGMNNAFVDVVSNMYVIAKH